MHHLKLLNRIHLLNEHKLLYVEILFCCCSLLQQSLLNSVFSLPFTLSLMLLLLLFLILLLLLFMVIIINITFFLTTVYHDFIRLFYAMYVIIVITFIVIPYISIIMMIYDYPYKILL